jgi:CHAT domain-containing protein
MTAEPAPGAPAAVLPDLPGAAAEARAVARLYGVAALVGADATEQAVRERLPGAAVVHLAAHGLVDAESPLASSVLLASGQQLTVAELVSVRLQAELVVLSACHTGAGRPLGGDELLGLGRALLASGARSAVVSLWPVDDLATAVLMVRFHSLRLAGASTAEALRSAATWLRGLTPAELDREYAALVDDAARAGDPVAGPTAAEPGRRSRTRDLVPEPPAAVAACGPEHPNRWAPFVLVGR